MIRRYLKRRDNPWELLAIAFLFLAPGLALVVHNGPVMLISAGNRARIYHTSLTPLEAHIFGWWAIGVGALCIVLYLYVRRSVAGDEAAPPPHFLDLDALPGTKLHPARRLVYDSPIEIHGKPHSYTDLSATDSTHAATFGFIGRHVVNIVSGVYLAASIANAVGRFASSLRLVTFIILAVSWVLIGVAVVIRELNGNRDSLISLGIGTLPPVIVGSAVVLLIARIIAHYEPAPTFSMLFAEWGLIFWIVGYLSFMRDAYHKKKLDEDLANKPDTTKQSSNHPLPPTGVRSAARPKDEL
jgi:hypothetical protein